MLVCLGLFFFFGVQLMCTVFDEWGGGLISCITLCLRLLMFVCDAGVIFAQMFVCECAPAAYLFHALLTKFLWSQLDVKGNPMSARLPLQAQNCVCV